MDHIKESIIGFLQNKNLKVLAIRGDWGVGKTYFWRENIIKKIAIGQEFYSYVSLFNIETINELKTKIYYESEPIKSNKDRQHVLSHIELINQGTAITQQLQKIKIDNYLICLDDIERKSKKVSMQTILGYISELKDNYSNKIVIIFNENELSRHEKTLLYKYKEKIIDLSIEYKPSAEYNQNIIFKDHLYVEIIKKALEPMNVKNMRILKFIKNNIDFSFKSLKNIYLSIEESVIFEVISTIVFDTWLYYQTEINIDLKDLEQLFSYRIKLSEEQEQIKRKIKSYGYSYLEEYEKEIISYLTEGYFNEQKLIDEIKKLSDKRLENKKTQELNEKLIKLWGIYNNNFTKTDSLFLTEASNFISKNIDTLSYQQLQIL